MLNLSNVLPLINASGANLNTSHVNVKWLRKVILKYGCVYLNTSHVNVKYAVIIA